MLVGHPHGGDGSGADEDALLLQPVPLAQALRPELAVPVPDAAQVAAVRHQHGDGHVPAVEQVERRRVELGRVRLEPLVPAAGVHGGRPVQQLLCVYTAHGCAEQAHGAEDAEPAAHVLGDGQRGVAFLPGDAPQQTALRAGIGGGDDVFGRVQAPPPQQIPRVEELAHRLGRGAGLGDDVEGRRLQLVADQVKQVAQQGGVHVVHHEDARRAPPGGVVGRQQVVERVVQRRVHGDVAQGGAPDAQHHEVVAPLAQFPRQAAHVRERLSVVG